MLIQTYVTAGDGGRTLLATTQVDALRLMSAAGTRVREARARGHAWTAGAVPFLVAAIRTAKGANAVEIQAANAAIAAWLCDSLYGNVGAEQFAQSNLVFTLLADGSVEYQRIPCDPAI
jgi:hypothetical protein